MKMEITEEQKKKLLEFYEKETKYIHLGEREDMGADTGITGTLDILGIVVEGING